MRKDGQHVSEMSYRVDYEDLSGQVYRMIKHMILVGELKTGEKLRQDELAERLGVSRTPLLSAFSKLEKEMLVELVPRRGAFVKKYELHELVDIYEIRVRLEPLGAAEAATNATDEELDELMEQCGAFADLVRNGDGRVSEADYEFHMKIMQLSRNQLLYNIISSYSIIPIANFHGFFKEPATSAAEHTVLCEAIKRRDVRGARKHMFLHIDTARRRLLAHLREKARER